MPVEELERDIYATGFFRQKAKAIRGTMRMLIEEFDGEVPSLARRPGDAAGSRSEDSERRVLRAGACAGHRRRHSRAPALAATRPDAERRPREDRAGPATCRATPGLGAVSASPHLARAPRLRRAPAAVPAVRGRGSLSFVAVSDPAAPAVDRELNERRDDDETGGHADRPVGVVERRLEVLSASTRRSGSERARATPRRSASWPHRPDPL